MPTSSNQAHDESDRESINDILSPSDGYFNEGHPHPGDVLVPDPSQTSTTLNKEREAREELEAASSGSATRPPQLGTAGATRASSSTQSSTHPPLRRGTGVSSSSRRSTSDFPEEVSEATPLISSAPPAYSPPEPGSPYHQHMRNGSAPGIYETIGRNNGLFPNSQQDMGGENETLLGADKDRKRWPDRIRAWWEENSYSIVKYIVLLLAFLTAVGFLVDVVMELKDGNQGRHGKDGLPDSDSEDVIPSYCKMIGNGDLDFSWQKSRRWSLLHLTKPPVAGSHNTHVQTMGKIHLRPAPVDTEDDIRVQLKFYYSSNLISSEVEFSKEDEILKIITAGTVQNYNDPPNYHPCLYLNITIWARPGLEQELFTIATTRLSIDIGSNYTALADTMVMTTLVGAVKSHPDSAGEAHWGGRDIKVITDAGSIDGPFPLYDSLWLETSAGHIATDLSLHPGRNGVESEALLTLKSAAGSIKADTPVLRKAASEVDATGIDSIPKRDYRTDILARAGSITLNLVHGSRTFIKTNAGAITAALTPWLEPRKDSAIALESDTGSVHITVEDSIPYKGQPLRHLSGDYKFSTGSLTLRYPSEWEGTVKGDLIAGSTSLDWPGMQVIRRGRQGPFNHFEAKKGTGDALLKFTGASGSAQLIGKGGSKYPGSEKAGDHRKVIPADDDGFDDPSSWPIFLPPLALDGVVE